MCIEDRGIGLYVFAKNNFKKGPTFCTYSARTLFVPTWIGEVDGFVKSQTVLVTERGALLEAVYFEAKNVPSAISNLNKLSAKFLPRTILN